MSDSLRYLWRHNVWASRTLLDRCKALTAEQLSAPAAASYGSIIETFRHLVMSDAGERVRVLDGGTYECPAGIVMAQVVHHGSVHREQICATLTALGIEPPDLQPWAFADATGISRFLRARTS